MTCVTFAPLHKAIVMQEFLAKNATNIIDQAPYLEGIAQCDFFLLSKLKLPFRGRHFESILDMTEGSERHISINLRERLDHSESSTGFFMIHVNKDYKEIRLFY